MNENNNNNSNNKETSTAGIISLIFGILGLFVFGIPFGLIAIGAGVADDDGKLGAAGMILGVFDIIFAVVFLAMMM